MHGMAVCSYTINIMFSYIIIISFRIFSPILFSTLYSVSLSDSAKEIGFPVDFHFTFILMSLVFLLTMILVAFFPKRLDKQKK